MSRVNSQSSLTERVLRGMGWVSASKIIAQALTLGKVVILARLLSKADFGLYGLVLLSIATLQTFSRTGFDKALVQRRGDIKPYLDTAWTVQIIRGILLALILFTAAPVIGWFFNEIRVVSLLRVMCISVVLGGCENVGVVFFQREFKFRRNFVYDVGSALVSLVVGVAFALQLHSAWALIWAGMAGAVTRVILSYVLLEYRPSFRLHKEEAVELFEYGRWVLAYTVILFLATQGDDAFLGKLLGASALGVYQVAYRLSNMPATEITHVTNAVMFPAYAEIQDEKERLRRAFLSVFEIIMTLSLPLTVFLIAAAPEIITGLLGAKWEAAIVPLQLLTLAGFLRSVAAVGGAVFTGTGKPQLDFWMNFWRVLVMALIIYPLTMLFGVAGTSLAVVLGMLATVPQWSKVLGITGVSCAELLKASWPGVMLALLVPIAVWAARLLPGVSVQMLLLKEVFAATVL
ncbi:MAG: lipopolysaccharide biosynthesis protein, partial [Deltaproteobacteria bacterium]|nr:lipopolysaccharide biosynthesis protein [Deltaproteobacteria bacterium]